MQREEQEVRQVQTPTMVVAPPVVKTREIVMTHPPMTVAKRVRVELSAVQDMLEQVMSCIRRSLIFILVIIYRSRLISS